MELDNERQYQLHDLVLDVQHTVGIPDSKVLIFGSCGTHLAFKNSDVDLYLECGEFSSNCFLFNSIVGNLLYLQAFTHIFICYS